MMIARSFVPRIRQVARIATTSSMSYGVFASRACVASAAAGPPSDSPYKVLLYDYVPDILEKRGPHRAEHIGNAKKMAEEGKMVMAGAFADPVDGGLFIFKDATKEEIDAYVEADPYVVHGLVSGWKIKPWTVVVP